MDLSFDKYSSSAAIVGTLFSANTDVNITVREDASNAANVFEMVDVRNQHSPSLYVMQSRRHAEKKGKGILLLASEMQ